MKQNFHFTKHVIVQDYDPKWTKVFEDLKTVFKKHLGNSVLDIQHVGSTAVPGLAAKPVIDLDFIVENENKLQEVIHKMKQLDYEYVGDYGIKGREVFKRNSEQSPNDGSGRVWMKHHAYACIQGAVSLQNHLKFRDFLRSHPELAAEYGALKKQLAKEHPFDIDAYVEKKTPFITSILKQVGFEKKDLEDIAEQNKAS